MARVPPRSVFGITLPDLGARCVEVFILISGFLEGYRHQGEIACTVREQFRILRRKLSLFYPLHLVFFVVAFAIALPWMQLNLATLTSIISNLTLTQAWFPQLAFSYNGVSWFLSALLFCYAMMPMLAYLLNQAEEHAGRLASPALAVGFLALRAFLEIAVTGNPDLVALDLHANPFVRMLEFGGAYYVGTSTCELTSGHTTKTPDTDTTPARTLSWTVLEFAAATITLVCVFKYYGTWSRYHFILLILTCIVLFSLERGWLSRLLGTRPFTVAASYMLPFFMSHQQLFTIVYRYLPGLSPKYQMLLALIATVAFCWTWGKLNTALHARQESEAKTCDV